MAGIVLEGLGKIAVPEDRGSMWEKVLRKLKAGQMPPAGLPRPSEPVLAYNVTKHNSTVPLPQNQIRVTRQFTG